MKNEEELQRTESELIADEFMREYKEIANSLTPGIHTINTSEKSISMFIGGAFQEKILSELEQSKLTLLLAPNRPEYYTVETRNIVGVDDMVELLVVFTNTEMPVAVQYHDMILNDVTIISIMPNVNDEGSYITFSDSNEMQLGIIVPKSELYSLFIKNITVEDDLMLFVEIDILYRNTPNMQYPYIWLDHVVKNDYEEYTIKGKLTPLMNKDITLVTSLIDTDTSDPVLSLGDLATITEKLKTSKELAFLSYAGVLVDDNYECYKISSLEDAYVSAQYINSEDANFAIPYTTFMNLEKDYTFKHYIDKNALVIAVSSNDKFQIINAPFENDDDNLELLGLVTKYYNRLVSSNISDDEINYFVNSLNCDGLVLVDAQNQQILLIRKGDTNIIRIV